jgi:hypothetical protein
MLNSMREKHHGEVHGMMNITRATTQATGGDADGGGGEASARSYGRWRRWRREEAALASSSRPRGPPG